MIVSNDLPNGIRYEGTEGWIFVTRGDYSVTASDPVAKKSGTKALEASNPKLLTSKIGPKKFIYTKAVTITELAGVGKIA